MQAEGGQRRQLVSCVRSAGKKRLHLPHPLRRGRDKHAWQDRLDEGKKRTEREEKEPGKRGGECTNDGQQGRRCCHILFVAPWLAVQTVPRHHRGRRRAARTAQGCAPALTMAAVACRSRRRLVGATQGQTTAVAATLAERSVTSQHAATRPASHSRCTESGA